MQLSEDEVDELLARLENGESYQVVSKDSGVSISDLVTLYTSITDDECVELREKRLSGKSYEAIARDTPYSILELLVFIKQPMGCDDEVAPVTEDLPWREPAVMVDLFAREELFFTEMSDLLGCHDETARNWVTEHGITRKGTHHTSSKTVRHLQGVFDRVGEDIDPHEVSLEDLIKKVQESNK
jgi:hypothetical protein